MSSKKSQKHTHRQHNNNINNNATNVISDDSLTDFEPTETSSEFEVASSTQPGSSTLGSSINSSTLSKPQKKKEKNQPTTLFFEPKSEDDESEDAEYDEDFFQGLEQEIGMASGGDGDGDFFYGDSTPLEPIEDFGRSMYLDNSISNFGPVGVANNGLSTASGGIKKQSSSTAAATIEGSNTLLQQNRLSFYGREVELAKIKKAVERISLEWMENPGEVLWITGPMGVGKSTLIKEASEASSDSAFWKAFVCSATCEQRTDWCGRPSQKASSSSSSLLPSHWQSSPGRPFQTLSDCLNDLCRKLMDQGGRPIWKTRLEEALGGEGPLLCTIAPKLCQLIESPPLDRRVVMQFDVNATKRLERISFAVRDLLQAVSEYHPVIMKVDNMQWIDPDSLRVMQDLLSNKPLLNFLLIGIHDTLLPPLPTSSSPSSSHSQGEYRQYSHVHPLQAMKDKLREFAMARITEIELEPFALKEVEGMLCAMLLDGDVTGNEAELQREGAVSDIHDLAEIIYALSKGNGLWMIQLLRLFNDLKLLTYQEPHWEWNRKKIKKEVKSWREEGRACFNKLDGVIQERLDKLPKKVKYAAQILGALRASTFHLNQLHRVCMVAFHKEKKSDKEPITTQEELEKMVQKGCQLGIFKKTMRAGCYKFTHEWIAVCAAESVKETHRPMMHFRMGTEFSSRCMECKGEERERFKFWSVDQLNDCRNQMDDKELAKLAKLNLEAAEIAMSKSAFETSLMFLELAVAALDHSTRWQEPSYSVTLRTFLFLARMRLCCGNMGGSKAACDEIFENTTSLKDRVYANQVLMIILMLQEKYDEALTKLLALLKRMGEVFPEGDKVENIVEREISSLCKTMEKKQNQQLLNPPRMTDKKNMDIMLLLASLLEIAKAASSTVYADLATIRMMHISLSGGFTRQYPLAFATFGTCLVDRGFIKEAHRMGQIAERIARLSDFYGGEAVAIFHWNISHWRRTYKRSLEPVLKIYNAQVDAGDFHHVDFSIHTYIQYHLASGFDLEKLSDNLTLFDGLYTDYDLSNDWHILIPQQAVSNLMGETDSPLLFFGATLTEQEAKLEELEDAGLGDAVDYSNFLRLFIAFFFHDFDVMHDAFEALHKPASGVWIPWMSFFECYMLIQHLPGSKGKKRKELKERIETLRGLLIDWYNGGAPNPNAMVSILEAEWVICKEGGKGLSAMKAQDLFNEAIEAAAADGATHLEAFACELAGLHFLTTGVEGFCSEYLVKSHKAYDRCNYVAKVLDLESKFADKLRISNRRAKPGEAYRQQNAALKPSETPMRGGQQLPKPVSVAKVLKSAAKGIRKNNMKKTSRKVKELFKKEKAEPAPWGWNSKSQIALNDSFNGPPVSPTKPRSSLFRPRKSPGAPALESTQSPSGSPMKSPSKKLQRRPLAGLFGGKTKLPLQEDDEDDNDDEEEKAIDEAIAAKPETAKPRGSRVLDVEESTSLVSPKKATTKKKKKKKSTKETTEGDE